MWGMNVQSTKNNYPGGYQQYYPNNFPTMANFANYSTLINLHPNNKHPQIVVVNHGYLHIQN